MDDDAIETIRGILDDEIRPGLAADGLDVELVRLEDGVAYVTFQGLDSNDVAGRYALQIGILQRLKEDLPELRNVESATI